MAKRLLITGADGFTGKHLSQAADKAGFEVFALSADLTDSLSVASNVEQIAPTHVVHLAAVSAVSHADTLAFYQVNVLGTENLLAALARLSLRPERVLLASSANVYGNVDCGPISEAISPQPVNHYAISKLSMEYLAGAYAEHFPLVIARPFNYTGVGHDDRFVVPKIVQHFVNKLPAIELGNLFVEREYNDVRTVCACYLALLDVAGAGGIYNICSGRSFSLFQIVQTLTTISGHELEVRSNPAFVRANEIARLSGNPQKLNSLVGERVWPDLENTLSWMYHSEVNAV